MARDLYETLGVSRTATEKEIRSAYRKLARRYHPDVTPNDKAAEARFKEVNAAFEVLSDPEKRKKYDKYGDRWEFADQIEEAQRRGGGRTSGGARSTTFNDFGDFGSVFDGLFRRQRSGPRRGQDIETAVDITLEEAFHGTTRTIRVDQPEACPTCSGTGEVAGAVCHNCGGLGQVSRERRLEVKVPAGVKTGSRVRVAGEGQPGQGGGSTGDLYLLVSVRPHPRFERNGDNLSVEVPVPLIDAVLGGEVEVPTIDGRVMLRLPELTQNGRQFRLAGKGMPVLGRTGQRGDLLAKVRVQLPERLRPEEREHFEALRRLHSREPAAAR